VTQLFEHGTEPNRFLGSKKTRGRCIV